MDATNAMNGETPPKKRGRPKGLPKTGGRVKGQPPLIPANLRAVCREVLGLDNLAIRKRLQRWYETGDAGGADHGAGLGSATFRHILLMGYGQPKHAMESGDTQRSPVIFLGSLPWDPNNSINRELDARSARLNEAKDQQLALEAHERSAAQVIEHGPQPEPESEDTLERVIPPPPPDPSAYR